MVTLQELFGKYSVDAENLDDFLDRYRKHDRYKGRDGDVWGHGYSKSIRKTHELEVEQYGVTYISKYESNTGSTVSWVPKK